VASRPHGSEHCSLKLYVGGLTRRSMNAIRVVRSVCISHLGVDRYELHVIDVRESPAAAEADHVVAVPTLLSSTRRLVGDICEGDVISLLGGI
jgi:KaiB domain